MTQVMTRSGAWAERGRRAAELGRRLPHAAEVMRLYEALCGTWAAVAERAVAEPPALADLPGFAVREALPGVVEATLAAGPPGLQELVLRRFHEADLEELVNRWLRGSGELSLSDRYLARAATAPILEALPDLAAGLGPGADDRHCPACGGPPQLAYFGISGEALLTAPRHLLCARCARSWVFPRLVCAGCGSTETARMPIYADVERFPGLRVDACEACRTYLLTVDLPKDGQAVPVVDELAGLPLGLYAQERGFRKLTPNLVGL